MEVELGSKPGEVGVIYSVLYCKSLLLLVVSIKKTVLLEPSMKASWTVAKEARQRAEKHVHGSSLFVGNIFDASDTMIDILKAKAESIHVLANPLRESS